MIVDDLRDGLEVLYRSDRHLAVSWGELPGLYGPTPCLDLATDRVWNDLWRWDWVRGSPSGHS